MCFEAAGSRIIAGLTLSVSALNVALRTRKNTLSSTNTSDLWLPRWGVLQATAAASLTLLTTSLLTICRIKV